MEIPPSVAILLGASSVLLIAAIVVYRRSVLSFFRTPAFLDSSIPSILLDARGRVLVANISALRALGNPAHIDSEFLKTNLSFVSSSSLPLLLNDLVVESAHSGMSWRGSVRLGDPQGDEIWNASLVPVFSKKSFLFQMFAMEMRASELDLPKDGVTAILAGSTDGIIVLRGDRIVYANTAAAHVFGYSQPTDMASVDFLESMVSSHRASFEGSVLDHPPGTQVLANAEVRGLTRTGRLLDLDVNARVIEWSGERALEVFLRDVTERKTLEREQALWRWEQEAMSEIDQKIAGVADAQTVFALILAHGVGLAHADWAILLTVDDDLIQAQCRVAHGSTLPSLPEMLVDPSMRNALKQDDQTVLKDDSVGVDSVFGDMFRAEGLRTMVWTPLIVGTKRIGLLGVGYRKRREPGERELRLLASLAEKCAIALMNVRQYERVLERERELERLSVARVEAQEEERRRIAKEIHDGIGQMLTAIKFNLEILEDSVPPDGEGHTRITDMKSLLDGLMREAREMSYTLMPSVLDDFGLAPALQMLCEQFGRKQKVKAEFQNHGLTMRLRQLLEVSLYRIAQDALSNVARHSEATAVTVQVIHRSGRVLLVIEDNGKGMPFPTTSRTGMGFVSMRERASQFGGTLRIESAVGDGTVITADIPLKEEIPA